MQLFLAVCFSSISCARDVSKLSFLIYRRIFFLSVLFQDPFEWEWRFSGLIGDFFFFFLYIIWFYFSIMIIIFEGWRMFFGTFRGSLQRFPKDPAGFSWINKSLTGCCWQTSATARANDVTTRFFIQQFKFNAARSDESRRRSPS